MLPAISRLGLRCLGISTGIDPAEVLLAAGAEAVVDDLLAALPFLIPQS